MLDQSLAVLRRLYKLTPREIEVMDLFAVGHSNKGTGQVLGISPRTVEVHRARAMAKLEVENTAMVAVRIGALACQFPVAFPNAARISRAREIGLDRG